MTDGKLQAYWSGFPEAPASDTFKWVDKNGFIHMTTLRAWAASSLHDFCTEFSAKVLEDGGKPLTDERPARAESAPKADDAPKKSFEHKPVPASELPADLPSMSEGQYSEYFSDEFDAIEVTPIDGGKATVKFLKDKMKYPVGAPINKWKNVNVSTILAPLGEFDLTVAKVYRVAGVQYWVKGNEYTKDDGTKGNYKDLKLVQATL